MVGPSEGHSLPQGEGLSRSQGGSNLNPQDGLTEPQAPSNQSETAAHVADGDRLSMPLRRQTTSATD